MKRVRGAAALLAILAFVVAVFQWFEASIEVRVLCSNVRQGADGARVREMFATGHRLEVAEGPAVGELVVSSPWDLRSSRCLVSTVDGRVATVGVDRRFDLARLVGGIGLGALGGLFLFQVALAAGAPLGRWAWGGARAGRLPPALRWASVGAALLLLPSAWGLAARTGLGPAGWGETGPAQEVVWFFFVLFALSAVANARSGSPAERRVMTPLAVLLAACFFVVAMAK